MNNFLQLSESRYSVRGYAPQQVDESDLEYILQSAQVAPSACNRQPWHFYVCQSEASLEGVRRSYPRDWFRTAPTVIVVCIDHSSEWVRPADGHTHGIVDVSIAAEHICLAAAERGLGTCWVCNFDPQAVREALQLPDQLEPAILLPLGVPTTQPTPKVRKPLSEVITRL